MTETPTPKAAAAPFLPDVLPIFPLIGTVLLPRGRLPLNVFEQRYLTMINDALGRGRMIGVIQPSDPDTQNPAPTLYQVGCAGRITSFAETDDGRYLITLSGLCRFSVAAELPQERIYRCVKPDWSAYQADVGPEEDAPFDRVRLTEVLRYYFKTQGIAADWSAVQNASGETLITSLTMMCPLEPNEKQALVEAPGLLERAELLTALLEMACVAPPDADIARH